jgi:Abnormal spindle-like microcephaly-assoc'd, ASPM-SPD-2-Hydin
MVSISPNPINFGSETKVGKTGKKKVTIKNTSSKASKVSVMLTSEMPSGAPFGIHGEQCVKPLAPGKNCKIEVTFTPTDTSPQMGTLTVNGSASNLPQTIPLDGAGK